MRVLRLRQEWGGEGAYHGADCARYQGNKAFYQLGHGPIFGVLAFCCLALKLFQFVCRLWLILGQGCADRFFNRAKDLIELDVRSLCAYDLVAPNDVSPDGDASAADVDSAARVGAMFLVVHLDSLLKYLFWG